MRIGIDLDDTIIAQFGIVVEKLNERFGFDIEYNDVAYWNWPSDHYPMKKQDILDIVYKIKPADCELTDPKIAKYFNKIGKKHDIDIITARWGDKYLARDIYLALKGFGIGEYKNIILCGKKNKQGYGFDVLIDDNPNLANGIIDSNNKTKLILFNQPWNWSIECEKYPHITRVNTWKQVYNVIKSL